MRIGIDGREFYSPAGGVRRYVWELYTAMVREPDVELVAIGAPVDREIPAGIQRVSAVPFPTNLGWMIASIPLAARRARIDVYHAPAYKGPLWGVHPQVTTIHDVSAERRPEWNAYRNDRLRRAFYRRAARTADRIVTDSTFSRDEIVAAYVIPSERITVVPLAAAAAFTPGPATLPPGIRQPYALHVGDLHVRRNLSTALAAVMHLRHSPTHQPANSPTFVCAGIDRGVSAELRAQAAADSDALVLTGPVSEEALLSLYRGAAVLLYPSRYEGFGLPVLEAMQCGVPVIAARAASIPEIAGDAAILLDEMDVNAWTEALTTVLTDPARAAALRDAGLCRAAEFTWTRTARETLAVLREAGGSNREL